MTKKPSLAPDEDLLAFEDTFDGLFGEFLQQDCKAEEIIPNVSGWSITIFFEDKDPSDTDSDAGMDLECMQFWANTGHFKLSIDTNKTSVTLSYKEICTDETFPDDVLDIFKRYKTEAKAYPKGIKAQIREVTSETEQKVQSALEWKESTLDLEALSALRFQSIIVAFPKRLDRYIPKAMAICRDICEREELNIEQESDDFGTTITMSKLPDVIYTVGSMDPAYVRFFEKLDQKEGVEVIIS